MFQYTDNRCFTSFIKMVTSSTFKRHKKLRILSLAAYITPNSDASVMNDVNIFVFLSFNYVDRMTKHIKQ